MLMKCHYTDLGTASDWLQQISHLKRPIRGTTQIWVITRHQYAISANFCVRFSDSIWWGNHAEVAPSNSGCFLRLLIRPGKNKLVDLSVVSCKLYGIAGARSDWDALHLT